MLILNIAIIVGLGAWFCDADKFAWLKFGLMANVVQAVFYTVVAYKSAADVVAYAVAQAQAVVDSDTATESQK